MAHTKQISYCHCFMYFLTENVSDIGPQTSVFDSIKIVLVYRGVRQITISVVKFQFNDVNKMSPLYRGGLGLGYPYSSSLLHPPAPYVPPAPLTTYAPKVMWTIII